MRTRLSSLLIAAFVLPGLAGCHRDEGPPAPAAQPPAGEAWLSAKQMDEAHIVVSTVAEGPVASTIVATGRVTFDDQHVTHVFSPLTGRVVRLLAEPGGRVAKGTPLAALASPDLEQAFSDLRKAEADFVAAERERSRQKKLVEAHAGAQRDLEAAESGFRKAGAELERARGKVLVLGPNPEGAVTQEYLLRAPIAGEVITRTVNPGAEVQGQYSGGNAVELFTIGKLDPVWVLGDVYEVDLPRIKRGTPAAVRVVGYPDRVFQGTVDWISDTFDPASRTAKVRCSLPNPDHALRPEMYASLSLAVEGRRALAVPRTAVLRLGDQTVVFASKGRTPQGQFAFERRPVTVDEVSGGDYVAVVRGLRAGERVVTTGSILLAGMV